jgi:hypothetical protein
MDVTWGSVCRVLLGGPAHRSRPAPNTAGVVPIGCTELAIEVLLLWPYHGQAERAACRKRHEKDAERVRQQTKATTV